MKIRHLYLSPGHNYYGHHGKPASHHIIHEVKSLKCIAGRGIEGDRFYDYNPDYKGQITFFALETYDALCAALNIFDKSTSVFRRNVITSGMDLNSLINQEFEIQGIRFAGTEEAKPCYWMNQAFGSGAEDFLKGQGGLRARILTDGVLKLSD